MGRPTMPLAGPPMKNESVRSALRAQVRERSGGKCEWPECDRSGEELAHAHSVGMGGRTSADTIDNVAFLCWRHARMSDGLQPSGWPAFYQQHQLLLGDDWERRIPVNRWAWERAEALTKHVARRRAALGFVDSP